MERIPTTERLAEALRQAGASPEMIASALAGHYDDYKSELFCPIRQLVADARKAGLEDIAQRAIAGDFDATDWEHEDWGQRLAALFGPPEGPAVGLKFSGKRRHRGR